MGDKPSVRFTATDKQDREKKTDLFAGWWKESSNGGKFLSLVADRNVVAIIVKDKDGEEIELDPKTVWFNIWGVSEPTESKEKRTETRPARVTDRTSSAQARQRAAAPAQALSQQEIEDTF